MDSGRLPAYRSSYLLRFHPYPRTKLSARERVVALAQELECHKPPQVDILRLESGIPLALNLAIRGVGVHNEVWLHQRRLSMSSLVDLALLFAEVHSQKDK